MQPDHSASGNGQLRKTLRLWHVIIIGLAYLTPMTVFDTFGIVSGITAGHVPSAYILALAGILFTGGVFVASWGGADDNEHDQGGMTCHGPTLCSKYRLVCWRSRPCSCGRSCRSGSSS